MHKILDVNICICCSFYQCKYEYANLIIRYEIKKKKFSLCLWEIFYWDTVEFYLISVCQQNKNLM